MKQLKLNGTQKFMGKDIPVIEGGFGEGCRLITARDAAKIHEVETKYINKLINNNIERFNKNDLLDLKTGSSEELVLQIGFTKAQYGNSNNIYLLSERGYTKLVSMMDNKNNKKWDIMDKFIDEYFAMREIINSNEMLKAKLVLAIYNGGQEGIEASKKLAELEVKEATAPLIEKNEELKQELAIITKKHTDWGTIQEINKAIRALSQKCYSNDYSKCYNRLYKKIKDNNGIDLKTRRNNYMNKTGKKATYLQFLKGDEIAVVKDIVFSACIKNDINLNKLLYVEDVFSGGRGDNIDNKEGFDL